jgi:hypothetical protein
MKYYFITYQATNRDGNTSMWMDTINVSPMKFIDDMETYWHKRGNTYFNFVILNTCEISEIEYENWSGHFC